MASRLSLSSALFAVTSIEPPCFREEEMVRRLLVVEAHDVVAALVHLRVVIGLFRISMVMLSGRRERRHEESQNREAEDLFRHRKSFPVSTPTVDPGIDSGVRQARNRQTLAAAARNATGTWR